MSSHTFLKKSATFTLLLVAGCQSYEHEPLDLAGYRQMWEARDVASEGVQAFAQRLNARTEQAPFDADDGVSLREAEAIALVFNPELRAVRLEARGPAMGAEHAGRWDDPQLGVDVLRILESVEEPWISGVGLDFTIPLSGRLGAEKALADAEAAAAWHEAATAEWEVLGRLREAWVRWSASRQRAVLLADYLTRLDGMSNVADRLADAGEITTLEARLLRIERLTRQAESARLMAEASAGRVAILSLLGLVPEAEIDLVPTLALESEARDEDRHLRLLEHPRMKLATARYEVAEQRLRTEIKKQYPDLAIGPRFEEEEGQSRVGLGLGIPVPVFNANRREITEAAAQRDAERARAEETYEDLAHEVAAAEAQLALAQEQRRLF